MNKDRTLREIAEISDAMGVSGFEDEVVGKLRKLADGLGEFREDSLRNLYLKRPGGGKPVVQLDAHTDEVGFMVQAVKPNGTLAFIPMGGWVACNVPAHRVFVRSSNGAYIPGIVASKPPHYMTEAEKNQPPTISQMSIDIGACSAREATEEFGILPGAPVVPDVTFEYNEEHDLMLGKAFDCRLGCAAILKVLQELQNETLDVDIVAAWAAQEEVGVRGAKLTSATVRPDIAIVFEGCPADDTCVEGYMVQTAIKKGPMLRHIDASMITNPRYQKFALDLAARLGIPTQAAVRSGGSTNGAAIHLSASGVPTIVIGLPVRYAHTHYGISSYSDFKNAVTLGCAVLRELNADIIASF